WLNGVRATVARERAAAELDHNDVQLRQGRHGALLPGLTAQAVANPLDERLGGQLMLALYRSGQQAEALHAYQRLRTRLADDLGVDAGADLQRLHTAMVRGEVDPGVPVVVAPVPRSAPSPVPAQLPLDVYGFTGREPELTRLDRLVDSAGTAAGGGATP